LAVLADAAEIYFLHSVRSVMVERLRRYGTGVSSAAS